MNEQGKIEVMNTILIVLGVLSVFFAGYILNTLFYLSVFLFIGGIIVLSVKAVSSDSDKGDNEV